MKLGNEFCNSRVSDRASVRHVHPGADNAELVCVLVQHADLDTRQEDAVSAGPGSAPLRHLRGHLHGHHGASQEAIRTIRELGVGLEQLLR